MKLILFYSWQNSTDTTKNHDYIQDCLSEVIKQINKTHEKQYHIDVQNAVRNIPGTKNIVNEIENRIENCDIFLGDMSIVNAPTKWDKIFHLFGKEYPKPVRNENVLIEMTQAMDVLTGYRVLSVMNSEYGVPGEVGENMPFDIRQNSNPILYKYDTLINGKDRNEFKRILLEEITNCANQAIKDRKDKFKPFLSWHEWGLRRGNTDSFKTNDYLKDIIKQISSENKDTRILGLSGTGKTRIVFEAFKETDKQINSLYYDCNDENISRVKDVLLEVFSDHKFEYTVILDNCELALFRQFKKIKYDCNSKSRIISIFNSPEEYEEDHLNPDECQYIFIDTKQLDDVVVQIIEKKGNKLNDADKKRIIDFASGIPLMAVLLCENQKTATNYGVLSDNDLFSRLLDSDENSELILESFSLFKLLNYNTQAEKIVLSNSITPLLISTPDYKSSQFQKTYVKYLNRTIIEQKGDLFTLRPKPLSFYLAYQWFNKCSSNRMLRVIFEIQQLNDTSIIDSLSEQIKYLGNHPRAKELIDGVVKQNSPFDSAEVIKTNMGSRLFRAFVEVNPEASVDNLFRNLFFLKRDDIQNIDGYVRRNLVWTLEKGCFYQPTFKKSAKLLLNFALAETETYGNNSTNQFLHLFKIYLPGTEVKLDERFSLIEYCLSSPDTREFGFKAIESAFDINSFYMGGAENQGLKKLDHYEPKENEIREYISKILQIIKNELNEKGKYSEICYSILSNSFREFYRWRYADITFPLIKEIIENGKNDWDTMYDELCLVRDNDMNIFQYYQNDILLLINKLKKDDFVSRFVAISDYRHNKELKDIKPEKSFEYFKEKYSELAKEFITQDIDIQILVNLFNIKYIHSIGFGSTLAELLQNNDKKTTEIIDVAIENIKKTEIYPQIFIEFAQHVNEKEFIYIVEKCKPDEKLASYLFSMFGGRSILLDKIDVLYEIADKVPKLAFNFKDYWSHNPTNKWDKDENIANHFAKLEKYGSYGINAMLYFIFEYQHIKGISLTNTVNTIANILLNTKFFIPEIERDFLLYSFEYLLSKTENHELAKEINIQFINFVYSYKNNPFGIDMAYFKDVYNILLKNYFDDIWPDLKKALKGENEEFIIFYKMKSLFGVFNSFGNDYNEPDEQGIFFNNIPCEKIQKELDDDIVLQSRIMGIAPTFNPDGKRFSDAVLFLIEKYGDNMEMLDEFRSNMNSFSCAGSMVPYYEKCKKCVELFTSNTKNITAKEWARELSSNLDEFIAHERKRDEEAKLLYE